MGFQLPILETYLDSKLGCFNHRLCLHNLMQPLDAAPDAHPWVCMCLTKLYLWLWFALDSLINQPASLSWTAV